MPLRSTTGKTPPTLPTKERRLRQDAGLLARLVRALQRWVRQPVGIYRLDGRWRAGLVERRLAPADALALRGILDDLEERLLAQEASFTADVLGQLVEVHDQMRLKGWAGVLALPEAVRARALLQAQMLAQKSPYPTMTELIERLRAAQPAAAGPMQTPAPAREGSAARAESALEVSEASAEEFEASQLGWIDTVPPLQPHPAAPKEPSR